jgi:hypothetical protein
MTLTGDSLCQPIMGQLCYNSGQRRMVDTAAKQRIARYACINRCLPITLGRLVTTASRPLVRQWCASLTIGIVSICLDAMRYQWSRPGDENEREHGVVTR